MTDQSDPDFSDDETTQTDASAPLVDYGNTPAEMTAETVETDMSTMPETRSAAQRTLAREVDEERQRMKVRNFPHGPGPSVRASAPEAIEPTVAQCDEELRHRKSLRELTRMTEEVGGYEREYTGRHCSVSSCGTPTSCAEYGCRKPAPEAMNLDPDLLALEAECVIGAGTTARTISPPRRPEEAIPPRRPEESRSLASGTTEIVGCTFDSRPRGDMKAGLTSSRPRLSIVPAAGELYQCRAMEYGADKYRRGNYHGAPPEGVSLPARVMGYIDAAMRHLRAVADAYNRECAIAPGPASLTFADALSIPDAVASGGFPASGLPHLAHAMASVSLAIQCGVDDGLLPEDPGQPWKGGKVTEDRSPEAATRFSHSGPAHADQGACASPDGCCTLPEPLWRGYRRADVLAVAHSAFGGTEYEWRGDVLWQTSADCPSFCGGEGWSCDLSGCVGMGCEEMARAAGLRRPDEPDYKPLA